MGRVKSTGYLFTSECVSAGHPDQVAASIADYLLEALLKEDPNARAGIEPCVTTDFVLLMGEVNTTAKIDYEGLTREVIKELGYTNPEAGFCWDTVTIDNRIHTQSPDIALGTNDTVGGAGDIGLMIGGAIDETPELMPFCISMARALTVRVRELAKSEGRLYPDDKAQVTVRYQDDKIEVDTIVLCVSYKEGLPFKDLETMMFEKVITPVLKEYNLDPPRKVYINPTGKFVIHGPNGDSGLNGRKLAVDTYGAYFPTGGGALAGKDPSKVDRSGAYIARYIAKNVVAAKLATKCEVQLSYAIGMKFPISVNVRCFGTNTKPLGLISKAIYQIFDMTPKGINETLNLREGGIPYHLLAEYGHFGERGDNLIHRPWEKTDKANDLRSFCEKRYSEK